MKKRIILMCVIAGFLLISAVVAARIVTQRLAVKAVKSSDYDKLEKICSMPIKNLDGIVICDFLGAIIEERGLDTPLEVACKNRDPEAIKILLKHGADPNYVRPFDANGHRLLETAIIYGDLEMVKLLVESGADVRESSLQGVDILIRYGAREKITLNDFKNLYSYLNENGACINDADLIDAVGLGADREVLQWLITEKGMSINSQNKKGQTFLHLCCLSGLAKTDKKEAFILYCIDSDADLNIKDANGKTAYDYAIEKEGETFAETVLRNS